MGSEGKGKNIFKTGIEKHIILPGYRPGWELYVGTFDGQHSSVFMYNRLVNAVPNKKFNAYSNCNRNSFGGSDSRATRRLNTDAHTDAVSQAEPNTKPDDEADTGSDARPKAQKEPDARSEAQIDTRSSAEPDAMSDANCGVDEDCNINARCMCNPNGYSSTEGKLRSYIKPPGRAWYNSSYGKHIFDWALW
jgi:hypothetical protein